MSTKVVSVVGKKKIYSFLEFLFLSFFSLHFLYWPMVLDYKHSDKKNCTLESAVAEGKWI